MRTRSSTLLLFLVFLVLRSKGQENQLVPDQPGKFTQIDWGVYTHWDCGFTKTETADHYKRLTRLIDDIRAGNEVLRAPMGFDLQARIFAVNCEPKFGYGIQALVRWEFSAFFRSKGRVVSATIEPPSWSMTVNSIQPGFTARNNYSTEKPAEVTNKNFDLARMKAAAAKLNDMLYTSGVKETLAPGIDRYNDGDIVIYNPDRPPYWLPVTVREVYEPLMEYWAAYPDGIQSEFTLKFLRQEWDSFTEEERNGPAYSMGKGALARVGNDPKSAAIMKLNAAYWDRSLPKSAIQLISFQLPADQAYLRSWAEEWRRKNALSYHEARFEASLDVYSFSKWIDRR